MITIPSRSEEQDRHEQRRSQGNTPAPTKAPLAPRSASPRENYTSGMETALGAQADKLHRPHR